MSRINWSKEADLKRMQRQGTEDKAGSLSKDDLRRQADALLAGYTGPVTKVAAGVSASRSQATTLRSNRKAQATASKARKSKGYRARSDLFGTTSKSVQISGHIGRSVPPGLVIYCDGACEPNPGAGGWGFVVYNDCEEVYSEHGGDLNTTNQRMELTAAIRAMEWIIGRGFKPPIQIFSDNMYTVEGCNSWRHGWKARGWRRKGKNPDIANLDLWKELDAALTTVPITLEWCKGHAGVIGNERADELALIGREKALPETPHRLIEQQLQYAV